MKRKRKKKLTEEQRIKYREYQNNWRKENRGKVRAYAKKQRDKNKALGIPTYSPEEYQRNKAAHDRMHSNYVEKNRAKINAYTNQYLKDHPSKRELTPEQLERKRENSRKWSRKPENIAKRKENYEKIKNTEEYQERRRLEVQRAKQRRYNKKMERLEREYDEYRKFHPIQLTQEELEIHRQGIQQMIDWFNADDANSPANATDTQI